MMKRHVIDGVEVWEGSGNVFADLGLPDAEELQIKSALVGEIAKAMRRRGLTQQAAARLSAFPSQAVGRAAGRFLEAVGTQTDGLSEPAGLRHRDQGEAYTQGARVPAVGTGLTRPKMLAGSA